MKSTTLTLITFLFSLSILGQTLNPKQFVVLKNEDIQIESAKRKDGTYPSPYLKMDRNIRFSPNGDYLFILRDSEKMDGKFIVYNTNEKRIEKTFKIAKTGMYLTERFVINPKNIYQVAVTVNNKEVVVIENWREAQEDAFIKKGSQGVLRIKAATQYGGQYAFSDDGKNLYIMEDEKTPLKKVDLASGKTSTITPPNGKKFYYRNESNPFIGNDEALIVSENGSQKTAEIYHIPTSQITRTYDISGFISAPQIYSYNPHLLIFNFDGTVINLKTGEKDETARKIINGLGAKDNNSIQFYPIPGKGYIATHLYYKETKGSYYSKHTSVTTTVTNTSTQSNLFFFDILANNPTDATFPNVKRELPWTNLYQLQISSDGRYAVFNHQDINNDKNTCWIIVTL